MHRPLRSQTLATPVWDRGFVFGRGADRIAVLILLLLATLSWLPRIKGPIDLRWDAGVYYILGTSLAEGKGYRLLNEPGEIEATLYPPLLPAIVAVHQLALHTTDPVVVGRWLRGLFVALFGAFVVATYGLLRTGARVPFAFLGTLVCTLTFLPVWLSDRFYSDLPFALALLLFVRRPSDSVGSQAHAWAWLPAIAAFLLRTIGIALLIAWVAEAVVRRRYRSALVRMVLALLPVAGWQLYVDRVQTSASYQQPAYPYQRADYNIYNVTYGQLFSLRDHLNPELGHATTVERARRAVSAVPSIVTGLGGAVSQPREQWEYAFERLSRIPIVKYFARWRAITGTMALLGLVVVAGLLLQLKRREILIPVTVLVYVAGLCSMPHSYFGELPRYLWVLSPLLMVSAFHAIAALYRASQGISRGLASAGAIGCAGLAMFVVALGASSVVRAFKTDLRPVLHADWNGHAVRYQLFSYTDYDAFDGGLEWLKRESASSDIVGTTTPHWVYLRTGRRAVFPPFERNASDALKLLDSVPVRYLVVADWLSQARVLSIVQSAPTAWQLAYSDGRFAIYQRVGVMTRKPTLLSTLAAHFFPPDQLERPRCDPYN